jgi:hypothetical protein
MKDRFGTNFGLAGTMFWKKPELSRRIMFRHLASAVTGYYLLPTKPMENVAHAAVTPINKAKNVIFVLLSGAASHVDTFDVKEGSWSTPEIANLRKVTSYGDVRFPQGFMPKLAENIKDIALVRSTRSWAVAHGLAQTWWMMGRNPVTSIGRISPHIGSVVSKELGKPTDLMPTFVALNSQGTSTPDQGYFNPQHSPFHVGVGGNFNGLGNTNHPDGAPVFDRRYGALLTMDNTAREINPFGSGPAEMAQFNRSARNLMYNAKVEGAFSTLPADRDRYSGTTNGVGNAFGNSCLVAKNLIKTGAGTRFIQISLGSWDFHTNIYAAANMPTRTAQLDNGLGALIQDLKADGLFNDTLIVMMGEFGRTVGALNSNMGRDHFAVQTVVFAGGGVKGGKAIGKTDDDGRVILETGWSRNREVRSEDVEATIYSALGVDWTKVLRDDPLGRGFEYIPFSNEDRYGPIHELWS